MTFNQIREGNNDFAFLYGRWRVSNRRLKQLFQHSDEWETFEAEQWCRPLLGGLGNMDEMRSLSRGVIGMSLRFFNLQTHMWSIYWVSPKDGILQPPVCGRFEDGVGIFTGDDILGDTPIQVRFTWSNTSSTTPCWQQEFSADGGQSWEKNWEMRFAWLGDDTESARYE